MRRLFFIFLLLWSAPACAGTPAGTITVDEESFSKPLDSWFHPEVCATSPGDNIFVAVGSGGKSVFKIPRSAYVRAMPNSFEMYQDDSGKVKIKIGKTAGCPETPFSVSRLLLLAPKGVDTSGVLITVSAGLHDAEMAKLRDSGTCTEEEAGLLKCSGRQTISGTPQHVEYFMAKTELQASGGPLRARCQFVQMRRFCLIADKITDDTSFEATLTAAPTLGNIRGLHDAVASAMKAFQP